MKRFKFSLETLLEIRTQNIQRAASDLFQCTKDLHQLHEQLAELKILLMETEAELAVRRTTGDYKYEEEYRNYLLSLNEEEKILLQEKGKLQLKLLESQEKTTLLMKERKVIAKLKEKKYALWESKTNASFK